MTDVALRDRAGGGGELELVDAFTERALAIAASAAAPNTRRAYATAYRGFAAFLHARYGQASLQTFTVTSVAAWRDELTAQGLAASTVAQRVSAVRRLAAAVGADPLVAQVRCTHVQQERPTALSDRELSALLARPDLRTTIGVRDRAILELLARAGLRRSELAHLTLADVQERGRQPDARRRTAIAPRRGDQTPLEVVVTRLQARPHAAPSRCTPRRWRRCRGWYASRPAAATDALFVSLRTRRSAISRAAVGGRGWRHRDQARYRRRRTRRPLHRTRAATHVLHDARRAWRCHGSHPRAGRPRRHPHDPDLCRCHR